ncbi:MAG: PEGA domain-containing protein [Bacteroidetes bacterium]|nr:PEGA domain-containing protein [Bacteroidota bacterium]
MRFHPLLLFFLIPGISLSQNLKEFDLKEMNEQQIPIFIDHPKEAAIVIYSAIPGLIFKSSTGGIVSQETEITKTTLFIRPEKQVITIQAPDFQEMKLISELITAKSTKFYRLNSKETNYRPDKGSVVINTVPAGAQLRIDGFPDFSQFTPFELKDYEARTYRIIIEQINYNTLDTTLVIERGIRQNKTFFLETTVGFLTLSCLRPVSALLNGKTVSLESEPVTHTLKAGVQSIKIDEPGFEPYFETFDLPPGVYLKKEIALVKLEGIAIFDFPDAVEIKINGLPWKKQAGTQTKSFTPGTYQLSVDRDGYEPWKQEISIRHKEQSRVFPVFSAKKSKLSVKVTPEGARVNLTGNGQERALGFAPVFTELMPGDYTLAISAEGYESQTKTVSAKNGKAVEVQLSLKKLAGQAQAPVYKEPPKPVVKKPAGPPAIALFYGGWSNIWFASDRFLAMEEEGTIKRSPVGLTFGYRRWLGEGNFFFADGQVFILQSVKAGFEAPADQLYLGGFSICSGWSPLGKDFFRPNFSIGYGYAALGENLFGLPFGQSLGTHLFLIGTGVEVVYENLGIGLEYRRSIMATGSRTLNQIQVRGGFGL